MSPSLLRRIAAGCVLLVGLIGLGGQAIRGSGQVSRQSSREVVHDARVDAAYYRCLDAQARSLIDETTPVRYRPGAGLGEAVILNKAVGAWITVSPPAEPPAGWLGIRHLGTPESCLGDVITYRTTDASGSVVLRIGHGASLPGQGPPPDPPL